jgi:hypothetical protein
VLDRREHLPARAGLPGRLRQCIPGRSECAR